MDLRDLYSAVGDASRRLHLFVQLSQQADVRTRLASILRLSRADPAAALPELLALLDEQGELRRYVRSEWPRQERLRYERWHQEQQPQQQQEQQQQQQQQQYVPGEGPYQAARLVNTLLVEQGADVPVRWDRSLAADRAHELRLNIGRYVEGSLLAFKHAYWPAALLPDGGISLRAVLTFEGDAEPRVETMYLPPDGDSDWVTFPFITPAGPATLRAEIVLYYEIVAVHVQSLTLPVGREEGGGPQARTVARLTRTFADLGKLAGRTASIIASAATSRVVVNGLPFAGNPFTISANAADTAALNTRQQLYNSHFTVRGGREYSRYDDTFSKSTEAFQQDLRQLAKEGSALFLRLFATQGPEQRLAATLPGLLRQEARLRDRPPTLQIIDDNTGERAMLWALVYDLPMGGDPDRYELCRSVTAFGPGSVARDIPPTCPYEEEHRGSGNVVCPFGFWGLSCLIEQPPDTGRGPEDVVTTDLEPPAVQMAADSSLDARLTDHHLDQLAQRVGRGLMHLPAMTEEELARALDPPLSDVVYLYCHSGYERRGAGAADRYLTFGDFLIEAMTINLWAMTLWSDPHWPQRHPLVVLNGCHTTEATSGTLNTFVTAFTRWAGASGVLGTEVTLEQGLASWAGEEILAALVQGATVGEAVRRMRWHMFRRGNVMGFAYTPYCLASLALRRAA